MRATASLRRSSTEPLHRGACSRARRGAAPRPQPSEITVNAQLRSLMLIVLVVAAACGERTTPAARSAPVPATSSDACLAPQNDVELARAQDKADHATG